MSPKEIRRKRGRPPASSPPASPRRHSSRNSTERTDYDGKRRREKSPIRLEEENEDEFSEIDEVGEKKVDKNGRLQGGRGYIIPTFKLPDYGDQEFMLTMDLVKLFGYADRYKLFRKNPLLKRVRLNEEERNMLINKGILSTWFSRDIVVVTARSAFKQFGSKIISNGRRVVDDYFENKQNDVEEEGHQEDMIIDSKQSEKYYFNEAALDNQNWIYFAALSTREFNAQLHERRAAKSTFYDIHSDVNQVPLAYQPQSCQFEFLKDKDDQQEPIVEYESLSNDDLPNFRGVGQEILDIDPESVLKALPEQERQKASEILQKRTKIEPENEKEDTNYPIALIEGQYQHAFPVIIFDTAQSLSAQQYYLGVVYQTVNQFADPRRQPPPSVRLASSGTFAPQSQQPMMPLVPPVPTANIQQQPLQPPPSQPQPPQQTAPQQPPSVCSFKVSLSQVCGRPVNHPGQLCQLHMDIPKSMSDHAKAPPPQIASYVDKCTDCHQINASDTLYTAAKQERITDEGVLVKCSRCTRKYHPVCANLTTPKQVVGAESYPWLCPECKVCFVCRTAGDESTLMICDGCDRGWHTGCCTPKVDHIPEGEWLCQLCAKCHGCNERGMKDESQYTHVAAPKSDKCKYPVYLATYCDKCVIDFKEDRFCPVCLKTYSDEENDEEDNEMVACDTCDHWVHTRCDESLTPERYQMLCDDESAKYSCPMCEDRIKSTVDTEAARLALKGLKPPGGVCVGLLGGKVKTRGVVYYKDIKVGIPEIGGSGMSELAS
ncbi:hypothetical protein G6F51_009602 [Rhizopus arrhizus]|uniref:PHD finger protein 10 n=2 Tax=Rhizopus TaxID=4842 RepID=A0A9P6Y3M2_RHIOR|nr:hypothetical protein G6F51_009602 [Rhizopus arrhizus]